MRARGLAGYDVALTWRRSCVRIASGPLPAQVAQLGERQTEDLNVPGSSPGLGIEIIDEAGKGSFIFNLDALILPRPLFKLAQRKK